MGTGLTTVLGLVVGSRDRLYALESMTAPGFPGPDELGTGQVVRIDPSGAQTVIATGLSFPTAMTFGPDGAPYVSNLGFGGPAPGARPDPEDHHPRLSRDLAATAAARKLG